jgi:transglutaminase-like putative cysteine protease
MRYAVHHTTTYQYTTSVSVCHNVVILNPRKSARLNCLTHRITVRPHPTFSATRPDAFGNSVFTFSIEENHHLLSISANSKVEVSEFHLPSLDQGLRLAEVRLALHTRTARDWFEAIAFIYDSPRITRSPIFSDYVEDLSSGDAPILQVLQSINTRIHQDFSYNKAATKVDTPTDVAFRGRAGVCQDFAHIAIACLRSIGIPARYVSGYLRTVPAPGKARMIGADQSHAWVSAWCGPELGWIDIDPTNHCFCSTNHIPIAWGRDYSDVVPIRGVYLGAGDPTLTVSVEVTPEP